MFCRNRRGAIESRAKSGRLPRKLLGQGSKRETEPEAPLGGAAHVQSYDRGSLACSEPPGEHPSGTCNISSDSTDLNRRTVEEDNVRVARDKFGSQKGELDSTIYGAISLDSSLTGVAD